MNKQDLKQLIKEEISKVLEADNIYDATEDDPYYAKEVGRDTGVKLNMRKIINLLKDAGYSYSINDGNLLFPKSIRTGMKEGDVDYGSIVITRNGEVFGSDLWGTEINSEEEVIPTIEEFRKDQREQAIEHRKEFLKDNPDVSFPNKLN